MGIRIIRTVVGLCFNLYCLLSPVFAYSDFVFQAEKDMRIAVGSPVYVKQTKSEIMCALQCYDKAWCRRASYNHIEKTCFLELDGKCQHLETETATSWTVIHKDVCGEGFMYWLYM